MMPLLILVQGCAARPADFVRPLRPLELATAPYSSVTTDKVMGSLMYEGGCLLFRNDSGGPPLLPIWPVGSVFNGTSVIFHEPGRGDQPILVAQHVALEGRALGWPDLPRLSFAPFQHQCSARPLLVARVHPAN